MPDVEAMTDADLRVATLEAMADMSDPDLTDTARADAKSLFEAGSVELVRREGDYRTKPKRQPPRGT